MESLNPLDQIQVPVIVAVIGLVVLTYVLLKRFFFAPYVAVMEAREGDLEHAESVLAEAEQTLEESEREAQAIVAAAREKAAGILTSARDEVEAYRKRVIAEAVADTGRTLESGRAEIAAAREAEVSSMRDEAIACVKLACDKLIGSAEEPAVEATIDKYLARRVY